ncbi:MAG: hypothetical protein F6J96_15830 [Symploca sp. SIO1C2]|nr:hypothetical protein [Symploca sp. SIO1C2]
MTYLLIYVASTLKAPRQEAGGRREGRKLIANTKSGIAKGRRQRAEGKKLTGKSFST